MHLPNAERAEVSLEKARYLLDAANPQNRGKAAFYVRFGFVPDAPAILAEALWRHGQENEVLASWHDRYGTRDTVVGPLITPDGRNPLVQSRWIIDIGSAVPRLTSAIRWRRG